MKKFMLSVLCFGLLVGCSQNTGKSEDKETQEMIAQEVVTILEKTRDAGNFQLDSEYAYSGISCENGTLEGDNQAFTSTELYNKKDSMYRIIHLSGRDKVNNEDIDSQFTLNDEVYLLSDDDAVYPAYKFELELSNYFSTLEKQTDLINTNVENLQFEKASKDGNIIYKVTIKDKEKLSKYLQKRDKESFANIKKIKPDNKEYAGEYDPLRKGNCSLDRNDVTDYICEIIVDKAGNASSIKGKLNRSYTDDFGETQDWIMTFSKRNKLDNERFDKLQKKAIIAKEEHPFRD